MLKQHDISELLAGGLSESEIRNRLLLLTPDKLNVDVFNETIAEVQKFCAPDFARLSKLGATATDCSGTGGSGRPRFNTSTTSAFLLAAGGVTVAKFGNRAATSRSGSFDLLNQLNISEKISAQSAARILDAAGLVFIFAPQAYPALGALSSARAALGTSTIFNFIGPLLNPVCPAFRVMGVADPRMHNLVASFLTKTTVNARSFVVRSDCGLDEICPCCNTTVCEVRRGTVVEFEIPPTLDADCRSKDRAYTPAENAELFLGIARAEDSSSYEYELLCANAGAGFVVAGKANSIQAGIEAAKALLADRKVEEQLNKVKEAYAKHAS